MLPRMVFSMHLMVLLEQVGLEAKAQSSAESVEQLI